MMYLITQLTYLVVWGIGVGILVYSWIKPVAETTVIISYIMMFGSIILMKCDSMYEELKRKR